MAYRSGTDFVYLPRVHERTECEQAVFRSSRPRSHRAQAVRLGQHQPHQLTAELGDRHPRETSSARVHGRNAAEDRDSAAKWFSPRESAREPTTTRLIFAACELAETLDEKTRIYDTAFNVALTPFTTAGVVVSTERERFDRSPLQELEHAPHRPDADVQSARADHRQRIAWLPALQGTGSVPAGLQRPRLGRLASASSS